MSAVCRTYEDFPPMFGPVISKARVEPGAVEREVLFGMYVVGSRVSTIGCLPPTTEISVSEEKVGLV